MNDATARARELRDAGVSFSRLPAVLADRIRVCASGCWEWQGGRNQLGYGRVEWKGRRLYVHRLVFSLLDRPIPDGRVLDHLCRNRPCCNPAHLDLVTRTENSLRAVQVARERIAAPSPETPDYRGRTGEMAAAARICVNPDHLEPVTSRENTLRGETVAAAFASRDVCGEGHEFTVRTQGGKPRRVCLICESLAARKRYWDAHGGDPAAA